MVPRNADQDLALGSEAYAGSRRDVTICNSA